MPAYTHHLHSSCPSTNFLDCLSPNCIEVRTTYCSKDENEEPSKTASSTVQSKARGFQTHCPGPHPQVGVLSLGNLVNLRLSNSEVGKKNSKKNIPSITNKEYRKKMKPGFVVHEEHRNSQLVRSFQHGFKNTFEILSGQQPSNIYPADFENVIELDLKTVDERPGLKISKFIKLVNYAPKVYEQLRRHFQIDEAAFLRSMCSEGTLRELPSPGKSGALFYITDDEQFFIKTIQSNEEKKLVSMFPSYHAYVLHNPDTFLTKYLGQFSVLTSRKGQVRMVVMASIFYKQLFIDRKYDLKGSTINRFASEKELQSGNVTFKDQDFDTPIFFRPETLEKIMDQLEKDTRYLQLQGVMDYSLLFGLSEMLPHENGPFKNMYGAIEEKAPYYVGVQFDLHGKMSCVRVCMGIIDFLQEFRTLKKVEYGLKLVRSCSMSAASVAPPGLYRRRFMHFIRSKFLSDSGLDVSALKSAVAVTNPDRI